MLVMLGSGLLLKNWWGESSSSQVCFLLLCGRVQSLWGLCGLSGGDCSLPARYPQACREDSCQMGIWFFSSLFDGDEAVCGAVMTGVVSAVFHLTHLVQWNKWPGSKCCFTVAESETSNISTSSVVLGTIFIYRQRLPLPLGNKCRRKKRGSEGLDCLTATCREHTFKSRSFDAYQKDCLFFLLMARKHGGVWPTDSPDHMETSWSVLSNCQRTLGWFYWLDWIRTVCRAA